MTAEPQREGECNVAYYLRTGRTPPGELKWLKEEWAPVAASVPQDGQWFELEPMSDLMLNGYPIDRVRDIVRDLDPHVSLIVREVDGAILARHPKVASSRRGCAARPDRGAAV